MADAAYESWMYGDPEFHDLREDLAAHHQVESGNIMVGEGIDGMLGYVARMFLQPGDTVVTSAGAYPTFNYHVNGYGGKLEFVPYRDDREDLDALIQKAAQLQARLIYVSNPDNPMGSWWDSESINDMLKKIPDGSLLILDEASNALVNLSKNTTLLKSELETIDLKVVGRGAGFDIEGGYLLFCMHLAYILHADRLHVE
mgnify:CR=1 FL=1